MILLNISRYDTNNTSTYSWNIAFRQLKFLEKGGSTYTRCRLIVGTIHQFEQRAAKLIKKNWALV